MRPDTDPPKETSSVAPVERSTATPGRLRIWADLWRFHRGKTADHARRDFSKFERIQADLVRHLGQATGRRILDLGCGARPYLTFLFHANGDVASGIDLAPETSWRALWQSGGSERLLKTAVRRIVFDRAYNHELARLAGVLFSLRNLDVRPADASNLPFETGTFDAIVSNAVFEHLTDVPRATAEIARVLRPGGIAHIGIHLFTSLSGGHHLGWDRPRRSPPADVPPWDHLRDNRFPSHVYLNRLRERDYRRIFDETLEVLAWTPTKYEGEAYLTPEIREELREYDRDELLKRGITIIARKPAPKL